MKTMPKWKIRRIEQIHRRMYLTLFVICLLCGAFALGCTITWEMVYGNPRAGAIVEIDKHTYGLYAGITDIDFTTCEIATVVEEEKEDVTATEEEIVYLGYTESDYELLAKLIYRETGGQGIECMIACGSVVLNRVNSDNPYYPDTLEEVIFQSGQYSVTFNRDRFYNTVPSEDAYFVAEMLLTNGSQIPSNVMFQGQSRTIGSSVWRVINGEVYCYE